MQLLMKTNADEELLTGLIYINENQPDFLTGLNMSDTPLAHLKEKDVRPSKEILQEIMDSLL